LFALLEKQAPYRLPCVAQSKTGTNLSKTPPDVSFIDLPTKSRKYVTVRRGVRYELAIVSLRASSPWINGLWVDWCARG